MNYKDTLNLPKTDFPMKANLPQREPTILKKWEDLNLYFKLRELGKDRKRFLLHDGPPYANAHIHMGTALNKVLKDIVIKAKTLSGLDAPYVPGWDCHGLPIELNVEKKIGKPGQKVTHSEFRKACRDYANSQIDIQREEFIRLGSIGDWYRPYLTMDFNYEANEIRALAKILKNGHMQKGYKPVHWCLDCCSALAEAEVEYRDKTSEAIDVKFTLIHNSELLSKLHIQLPDTAEGAISIPIWTTTPWSLPANHAVAVNPDIEYSLVQTDADYFLVASGLVTNFMERIGIVDFKTLGTINGRRLEGIKLQHPFYPRIVPTILSDHVTVDAGTGAVHIAPVHGEDDFALGKKYQLPLENPVGDDGCYTSTTPLLAGVHVNKANALIIDLLRENGTLIHFAKVTHSYPHCWRHKTPLIFRATPQWFISMDQNHLREEALSAISRVKWIPDWGQQRITTMVINRPDWCISRQRTWGVPIPLFLHKETGDIHPNSIELMEEVAKKVEQSGVNAWFDLEIQELLGNEAAAYRKCTDILDVWLDSGVTHECVLRTNPDLGFPADLYLEGSDQHRGWFQSSLMTSVAINKKEPFKTVLTHGYVVDMQKQKMSKSIGNVISPDTIIKAFGADVLRLWVASIDYRGDIFVGDEVLVRTSETYRRMRNTARFLLANLTGFDPKQNLVKPADMVALDRWIVDKTRIVQEEILAAYEAYQFHLIYQKIHHFCAIELGSFYLDIIKDRQYTTQENSLSRRSAQTAMFHIVEALVRWLAPILSFTAEEIWEFIPGKREPSVFFSTWYKDLQPLAHDEVMNETYWETLRQVRDAVNKQIETQRNEGKIGSALEADVEVYCSAELKKLLDALENELRFVFITSAAKVHLANSHLPPDVIATDFPGLALKVLPLSYKKCERCWHRLPEVGHNKDYPTICNRCIENVSGKGEQRKYA